LEVFINLIRGIGSKFIGSGSGGVGSISVDVNVNITIVKRGKMVWGNFPGAKGVSGF
jgi:hypothetical protein